MKSALEVYEKFLNAITKAVGVIAGILLLLPALMVFYEVVMRGLFNAPTEWSIELSVYCVLVAGFLGMSVTYAAGKHIHVDIVLSQNRYLGQRRSSAHKSKHTEKSRRSQ